MKKFKTLSIIAALCTFLSSAAMAIKPPIEERIQQILATQSRSSQKNVELVLAEFTPYLAIDDSHLVAKYLVFYIYTLYPVGLSSNERIQLINFFEKNLKQTGLPAEITSDFFNAMERAREDYKPLASIKPSTISPITNRPFSPSFEVTAV